MNNEYTIQTFNLVKNYGERVAVNDVNLTVNPGEMLALLGPNGAGKTTTIKMLCCLLAPTSGTAVINGHDIGKDTQAVKEIIDVSPQETAVAGHLNVFENLSLMGGIYGLSRAEIKKRSGELVDLFGLRGRTDEQVRKFSGGMQRRLSIAMALISDPEVLFLDEPTLGLDPQSRRAMWKQIKELKGKKTIVLTTHYLEEADSLADRIAIMNKGSIIADGTPGELKHEVLGMQAMAVKAEIPGDCVEGLKEMYPNVLKTEVGIEIKAKELDFDRIVDYLRSRGVKIKWLSMKEPTLDDVFLNLTGEEVQ